MAIITCTINEDLDFLTLVILCIADEFMKKTIEYKTYPINNISKLLS